MQGRRRIPAQRRPQTSPKVVQLIVSSEFTVIRPGCLSERLLCSCSSQRSNLTVLLNHLLHSNIALSHVLFGNVADTLRTGLRCRAGFCIIGAPPCSENMPLPALIPLPSCPTAFSHKVNIIDMEAYKPVLTGYRKPVKA